MAERPERRATGGQDARRERPLGRDPPAERPEPHGLANVERFEPEPHGLANDGKFGPEPHGMTKDEKLEPELHGLAKDGKVRTRARATPTTSRLSA